MKALIVVIEMSSVFAKENNAEGTGKDVEMKGNGG